MTVRQVPWTTTNVSLKVFFLEIPLHEIKFYYLVSTRHLHDLPKCFNLDCIQGTILKEA